MDEVSDVEDWSNIHYGYAVESGEDPEVDEYGIPTTRSRSRASNDDEVPQPKAMPKPLAKQVARRIAQDTAEDMIEAIENSGSAPFSSTGNPTTGNVDDNNYFLCSVPVANFWNIMPVPREPLALEDYRWDLLGQGIGPENLVVINCRNLSRSIAMMTNPMDRERHLRLLRNLQNLLIKFQSGKPENWVQAAEQVCDWVNHDGAVDFFEDAVTEAGDSLYSASNPVEGEGEEEERDDASDRSYDYDYDGDDGSGQPRGDGDRPPDGRVAGGGTSPSAADGGSAAG